MDAVMKRSFQALAKVLKEMDTKKRDQLIDMVDTLESASNSLSMTEYFEAVQHDLYLLDKENSKNNTL